MNIRAIKRWLPIGVIALAVVLFFALDFDRFGSLSQLKLYITQTAQFTSQHPIAAPLLFIATYILCIVVPTPLPFILCITGGILFNPYIAAIYCALGETLGGVIIVTAIDTSLGHTLQNLASNKVKKLTQTVNDHAINYISVLRLSTVVASFIINLVCGVIRLPMRKYIPITLFCSLPSAFIFCSLGSVIQHALEKPTISYRVLLQPSIAIPLIILLVTLIGAIIFKQRKKL